MLPLQWFSVLVEWIEIWFLAMHSSSSNYCMLIFSPTTIGWKFLFVLSFCCLVSFFLHSFIFPLYQTLLLQSFDSPIYLTSLLIVAYFFCGHYFSFHCYNYFSFYYIVHFCLHWFQQSFLFSLHLIVFCSISFENCVHFYPLLLAIWSIAMIGRSVVVRSIPR